MRLEESFGKSVRRRPPMSVRLAVAWQYKPAAALSHVARAARHVITPHHVDSGSRLRIRRLKYYPGLSSHSGLDYSCPVPDFRRFHSAHRPGDQTSSTTCFISTNRSACHCWYSGQSPPREYRRGVERRPRWPQRPAPFPEILEAESPATCACSNRRLSQCSGKRAPQIIGTLNHTPTKHSSGSRRGTVAQNHWAFP